jgi:hypothetical protein
MSFSSSDVEIDYNEDYEITIENVADNDITYYVCTVTVYYNGSPVKTFTSGSYFESMACNDGLRQARAYIQMAEGLD